VLGLDAGGATVQEIWGTDLGNRSEEQIWGYSCATDLEYSCELLTPEAESHGLVRARGSRLVGRGLACGLGFGWRFECQMPHEVWDLKYSCTAVRLQQHLLMMPQAVDRGSGVITWGTG
jgi:hypothetical protein